MKRLSSLTVSVLAWVSCTVVWVSPVSATYSIVAADQATGQVGGSGTSCVGTLDVFIIYGAVPGKGAVHAQAQLSVAGRDEAVRLLGLDS